MAQAVVNWRRIATILTSSEEATSAGSSDGEADDTLLVARISDDAGNAPGHRRQLCLPSHNPGLDNSLISPDWWGRCAEVVERCEANMPVLARRFGDWGHAKARGRYGRRRQQWPSGGVAALSALGRFGRPPGTEFRLFRTGDLGHAIGTWRHEPLPDAIRSTHTAWRWEKLVVELLYRHDLPSLEQTQSDRERWLAEEARARAAGDDVVVRDCRAQVEQCTRQLTRLKTLVPDVFRSGDGAPRTNWRCDLDLRPGSSFTRFSDDAAERFCAHPSSLPH